MLRPQGLTRAFTISLVAALLVVSCGGQGAVQPSGTAAATGSGSATGTPITIGVLQTMTGGGAYYGLRLSQGIQLAVDTINGPEPLRRSSAGDIS